MKKRLFLIAAAALALVACAKEEAYEPEVVVSHKGVKVTIGASFEDLTNGTKSDYTAGGDFYWSTGDAIWIGSDMASDKNYWGYGSIITNQTNKGPGYATADFDCVLSGGTTTAVAAVFPYESVTPSYTAGNSSLGTLSLELKKTISWANSSGLSDDLKKEIYDRNKGLETTDPKYVSDIKFMQADNVMVARYEDIYAEGYPQGTTTGLQFYNVGGVFCLTLNNIPPGAEKLVFTTDKKITGTFAVSNVEVNNNNYPQIDTEDTENEAEKSVTIEFETITTSLNTRVFFIPVPVGSFKIGFDAQDHDGNSLWKFSAARANKVERGHIVKMPALTHVVVSGDGDGATNIITTPTGCNETVYLPSTESNIYVRMNQTGGTITLAYSTIEGAKHPANVYLEALGDIENLNINLPDSHVELKGSGSVAQVITNVTSYTSYATLKVESTIKIGKDSEDNSGLTITGGSLDLAAEVVGPVTVNIPPSNNNETEEKVSINITSAIKDLVVTRAADSETPADKVYVTLGTGASVEAAIEVPEVNCNLYIAPGVSATTVTTSAAENTIEGTVTGTLTAQPKPGQQQEQQEETSTVNVTVTGTVANLAATGGGTTVVVEEGATVSTSISSTDKAVVVVVVDESTTAVATIPTVQDQYTDDSGEIVEYSGQVVAMIGNTTYSSLDSAIEAAESGATITILKDVEISDKLIVALENKSVTLNLGGNTLTGRVNLTNGNLTVKNGSVKNVVVEGQPLNVYGSSTPGAQNYSVLNVASDVTVEGHYGICVFGATASTAGYGAVVNFAGKIKANDGIFVSGNLGNNIAADMNNVVNVTGKIEGTETGIALNGWATVNVQDGANISANTGIALKRGVLNVADGATVTGNGTWNPSPDANNNGTELTGAAVSMTNTYNYLGAMAINIAGGSFTSVNGQALLKADQNYTNAATFTVTGGTFSSDPTDYLAAGYTTSGNNPWTVIKREGAVTNLAELQEAISNHITPIYYIGEAITEAFTLTPSVATTIHGLKVNHQTVASNATTLTINGDVTLNDANIISKAYCAVSVAAEKTVTLKDCVVDGSTAAASDSRTMNIYGGATVTIDHSTVKGPATAGYSRCINVLDEGAHIDIVNGSVLSVSHYAINLPSSAVNAVINVNGSSVNTGWAITNIWKTGNTINLTNCTLNSVNDKTQAPDNSFSAFVFNQGGSGNTVTVNNCAVSVSSPSGNLQSLISLRGTNDTIKFIGSDGTISLAENGGITYQWGQLHSVLNNTLSFDKANYDQIEEDIDYACVVTTANDLYTITYLTEVFYYWDTQSGPQGSYCSLAEPFAKGWLSDNEYIRLERNVTLTANITATLSEVLHADNYFTMTFGDYNITKGEYSIILPAGLSVKTDKQTTVFTAAAGAEIVETVEDNVYTYTAVAKNYVAQIGSTKYETLEEAFAAVPAGTPTTITMIANANLGSEQITIASDKDITLELNGKTVSKNAAKNDSDALFCNRGTLTIQDNTDTQKDGTGTGKVSYWNGLPDPKDWPGYATNTITNNGALTIKSGYVENITEGGYAAYTVDNQTNGTLYTPVFNMEGGKLYNKGTDAIRMFLNSTSNLNQVNVSGGIIDGSKDGRIVCIQDSNANASKGEFNMTGGVVTKDVSGWSAANNEYTYTDAQYEQVRINISGGQMRAFLTTYMPATAARAEALRVTGGTFNTDPSAYVAPGYAATQTSTNVWTVDKLEGVAQIGNVSFETLDEALNAANTDDEIILLSDITVTGGYTISKGLTINLNGHTITADATNANNFPNSRVFKFAGSDAMTNKVYNGEIKLLDDSIYGPFRFENGSADYILDGLTLNNKKAYGLGVKIINAKSISISNTTINSVVGGGIEKCDEYPLILTNVTINQSELDKDHKWISCAVAASYDGPITINSGSYSGYTSVFLYSSGGEININDGTFFGSDAVINVENNTQEEDYKGPSVVNVTGGTFTGAIKLAAWGAANTTPSSTLNISGGTFSNPNGALFSVEGQYSHIVITGGTFDHDPSTYVANGYQAIDNNGIWTVLPVNQ